MNNQKDIQGHGLISHKPSNGIETFGITLSKKCERLATAIYLVTNFLSDTEPLKSRLRTLSIEFIRDSSAVKNVSASSETNILDALRGNISETLSLLELAFISGLVSEMNFTILKREYTSLRGTIDVKKTSRESHTDTILGDTFFGSSFHEPESSRASAPVLSPRSDLKKFGPKVGPLYAPAPAPIPNSKFDIPYSDQKMSDRTKGQAHAPRTKRPDLSASALSQRSGLSVPASAPIPESADSSQGRTAEPRLGHSSKFDIPYSVSKDSRRSRILKLIKDNREVAIKDIVAHFPDLSEKTIQRELVAMSDSGVLKKSGERRWSRYSLAIV